MAGLTSTVTVSLSISQNPSFDVSRMRRILCSLAARASSAFFRSVRSRTIARSAGFPPSVAKLSVTSVGNTSPVRFLWSHSNRTDPFCRASATIRSSFSREDSPSAWSSGENSYGLRPRRSEAFSNPSIRTAASFTSRIPVSSKKKTASWGALKTARNICSRCTALRDVRKLMTAPDNRTVFENRHRAVLDRQPRTVLTPQELIVDAAGLPVLVSGEHVAFFNWDSHYHQADGDG